MIATVSNVDNFFTVSKIISGMEYPIEIDKWILKQYLSVYT